MRSRTVEVALELLAVARLTELVVADDITRRPVEALIAGSYRRRGTGLPAQLDTTMAGIIGWRHVAAADPGAPWLARLITCPWCTSMWVAAAVLVAREAAPGVWRPLARLLAGSQVAGMLHRVGPGAS